jgi:hypothetical protein
MTPERLIAAQTMRAQGMTLIQIAATLGVGRSSLVRALAQAPDSPAGPTDASVGPRRPPWSYRSSTIGRTSHRSRQHQRC